MIRVKKRTFSGIVLEQEVFNVSERSNLKNAEYEPRFADDEERAKHRLEMSKRHHRRLVNANFTPASLYSTLTFDVGNECHDYEECKKLRDLYVRRLKYAYPDAVIFIYCGQGKTTHRFHLHMLSDGVPEEAIIKKWSFGEISRVEHLREHCYYDGVDHGPDYTALADYLFNHWTPEQGSHRWKATKNAKKPEKEPAKEAKRIYSDSKPPRAPKGYALVESKSNKYGYQYYKYVKMPSKPERARRNE